LCYAIPGKLVEINGNIGIIDYFGEKRKVIIDTYVKVGDYVYAQGGVLINKISEKEAKEILEFWKEKFTELKNIDRGLSKLDDSEISYNLLGIFQKANLGKELTKKELHRILELKDKKELKALFQLANSIRQRDHDNACCVHGIIEFSNFCKMNCFYCGIRSSNPIKRYRLEIDEIVSTARKMVEKYGFKALVLQSGEDAYYDENKLIEIVKKVRKLNVLVFLSIGDRSKSIYQKLYDAGARAALLRFESSNEEIFHTLRPGTKLKDRIQLIKDLKDMGYVIATGFIVGLPGETNQDIINNILLTKSLKADMYSFGPLMPASGTPLEKLTSPKKESILKVIALTRLVDRKSNILVTTALETLDGKSKRQGLLAGANSLMLNITPKKYAGLYSIYNNKAGIKEGIGDMIKDTISLLYSIGRAPTDLGI
jgi:biotin synthase